MVRKKFLILFALLFGACANLSKNQVITEEFDLRGGKYANQQWDDSLSFQRTSWYSELTLVYDLLLTKMTPQSPFWQWLSNTEKETINSCKEHYIAVAYAQDSKKVSHSALKVSALEAGYRSFALPQFSNFLQLHPDFAKNSFHLYTVFGLCLEPERAKRENILLQFPNFKEVVLQ